MQFLDDLSGYRFHTPLVLPGQHFLRLLILCLGCSYIFHWRRESVVRPRERERERGRGQGILKERETEMEGN